MPDTTEDEADDIVAEDRRNIREALKFRIAPICAPDEITQPLGYGATEPDYTSISLDTLVEWRLNHQTRQAANGVRVKKGPSNSKSPQEISARRQLIRGFHQVLKEEEQERGICTGSNRNLHWSRTPAAGGRDGEINGAAALAPSNGNSLNAVVVATAVANKVC